MLEKLSQDALVIWATIDPIGTMALFAALTINNAVKLHLKRYFMPGAYYWVLF